ncbi:MAG: hypothetical protein AVDCRST_MAG64-1184, partial [uncultured Phycisphaerae bacterium]
GRRRGAYRQARTAAAGHHDLARQPGLPPDRQPGHGRLRRGREARDADRRPPERALHRGEQARVRPPVSVRRGGSKLPETANRPRPARPAVDRRDDHPARQAPQRLRRHQRAAEPDVGRVQCAGQHVPERRDRQVVVRQRLPVHQRHRLHRGALQHQPDRPRDQPPGRAPRKPARHRRARHAEPARAKL